MARSAEQSSSLKEPGLESDRTQASKAMVLLQFESYYWTDTPDGNNTTITNFPPRRVPSFRMLTEEGNNC